MARHSLRTKSKHHQPRDEPKKLGVKSARVPKPQATNRVDENSKTKSPSVKNQVFDYDPIIFVRCHARDNDPNDAKTQAWRGAFEPDINHPGQTTNTVATCGGNIVCLLNATTGLVEKRYLHSNDLEDFYALAWTVMPIETSDNKITLLAAGGVGKRICLIHPKQLVCYHAFKAHTKAINCLTFHPSHPTWLFSGSSDEKVHLWDIHIPAIPDKKTQWYRKILTLDCGFEVLQLALAETACLLITACDGGLLGWNVQDISHSKDSRAVAITKYSRIPDIIFHIPDKQEKENDRKLVDGLSMLTDDCIVIKCSGTGQILIWSLSESLKDSGNSGQKKRVVTISLIHTLIWSSCTAQYLYLSSHKGSGLVVCGDDEGKLWLYDVKDIVNRTKSKPAKSEVPPSLIIPWPVVHPKPGDGFNWNNEDKRVIVNSSAISWNAQLLVACTDKGLVCLWRKCVD